MSHIDIKAVVRETGLSKSTIYDLMSRCAFPARVKMTVRAARWDQREIDEFVRRRRRGLPWLPIPVNLVQVAAHLAYDQGSEDNLSQLERAVEEWIKSHGAQVVIDHIRAHGYSDRFEWPNGTRGEYPRSKSMPKRG
jgi:predicted DNA-binding transcriptional regulator AlpA